VVGRRPSVALFALVSSLLTTVGPATAHSGTTHAGTPHWVLFALFVGGIGLVLVTAVAHRRGHLDGRWGRALAAGGLLAAVLGGIGVVELQVVGESPPTLVSIYPLLSLVVGGLVSVGGFFVVRFRYPRHPLYAILCLALGAWIAYPAVLPDQGYRHPLGYLIVASVPILVGAILWTEARGILQSLRLQRRPLVVGLVAGVLMSVFFAFSAGTMTLNPDQGLNAPTETVITAYNVASPLVIWPAIEWYVAPISFAGYLSVGTLLLMGVLGGLVGLNVAVLAQQWSGASATAGPELYSGSLAVTGATACCCCAPAFYGLLSVVFGAAATPVYWSFMIPSSPVGSSFFAASVLLLLASVLRSTGAPKRSTSVTAPKESGRES
jgi:hypothetical protein